MTSSFSVSTLKDIFGDFLSVTGLRFFVWWYGRGLKKTTLFCWGKIRNGWHNLAIGILIVNFFKPMYGYGRRDFAALVLSIGARFWLLIGRLVLMVLWLVVWLAIFLLWVALPILSVLSIFSLILSVLY